MRAARHVFEALKAGAAWLGLAVVLGDDSPGPTLGAIATLIALVGGWAGRASAVPLGLRLAACLLPVLVARGAAGTAAAALAATCIAFGWWLRLRFSDGVIVLAAIGIVVVATTNASWRLLLAFAIGGTLTAAFRPAWLAMRRLARRAATLRSETALTSAGGRSAARVAEPPLLADRIPVGRALYRRETGGEP